MQLKGKGGIVYNLYSSPFASGGEGEIYDISGLPDKVAKLYKNNKNTYEREMKLSVMSSNPPDNSVLSQIAWPLDVLYNGNKFVGFVMPKVKIAEELNVIYEYGSSAKYPSITWRNKITIAKNLCAVLDAVHNAGHVVGDFNPKNISVDPKTGHIVMVDTDSYHIEDGKYRCGVGMPDYLPVEIQRKMKGASLETVSLPTFSKETDNFALAVHIFQLLMNGVHPFACAILPSQLSVATPNVSDSILKGEFAFMQNISGRTIPKFAPPIDILPKELQELFRRAFVDGYKNSKARPNAVEWYNALKNLESKIIICSKKKHHEYYNRLSKCPWCEADNRFNSVTSSISQSTISTPLVTTPKYNFNTSSNSYNTQQYNAPSTTKTYKNTYKTKKNKKKIFRFVTVLLLILIGVGSGIVINLLNTFVSISLTNYSEQIELARGDKIIDYIGTAEVKSKIGTTKTISITDEMISGYDPYGYDIQIIKISYRNYSQDFEVAFVDFNLAAPKNININDGKIVWEPVTRALSYTVMVNDLSYTNIQNCEFILDDDTDSENYNIKIKAVGNEMNIFSSDFSNVFSASRISSSPQNVSILNGKITWDEVIGYNKFRLYLDGIFIENLTSRQYTIPSSLDSGIHTYSISVAGDNSILDSSQSYSEVFKLATPTDFSVNNHLATWSKSDKALEYKINVSNGSIYTVDNKTNSYDLFANFPSGEYSISITAIGNGSTILTSQSKTIAYTVAETIIGISNEQDLINIKNNLNGKYALLNDITLTSNWTPIMGFSGTLNGKGYTIKNLNISTLTENGSGLFGTLSGTVTNLKVEANISAGYAGGIAGISTGTITNCEVSGRIGKEYSYYIGGIVGQQNGGKIDNCKNFAEIIGGSNIGGIAGYVEWHNASNKIENCTNEGDITGVSNIGGITGRIKATVAQWSSNQNSSIITCINNGSIIASGDNVGGIVGYASGGYASGGGHYYHTIDFASCENYGDVTGKDYVGGILGNGANYISKMTSCINKADIIGNNYVGGYVGLSEGTLLQGLVNNNTISGKSNVGGIAGKTGSLTNCTNKGSIIILSGGSGDNIGGLVGYSTGTITGCKNEVPISSHGSNIGGIAGYVEWHNASNKIENCTNEGDITGVSNIGGITGRIKATVAQWSSNQNSSIITCINNGSIIASGDNVGGIVGYASGGYASGGGHYYHTIDFASCENYGDVTGKDYVGGILGYKGNYISHNYCVNYGTIRANTTNKWDIMA